MVSRLQLSRLMWLAVLKCTFVTYHFCLCYLLRALLIYILHYALNRTLPILGDLEVGRKWTIYHEVHKNNDALLTTLIL